MKFASNLSIFSFLILLSTIRLTCSTGKRAAAVTDLSLFLSPAAPSKDEITTLTCRINKPIRKFHLLEIMNDGERVILHKFRPNITDLRGQWEERKGVNAYFITWKRTLIVKFKPKLSDNGYFTCQVQMDEYGHAKRDMVAKTFLWLQLAPEILEFSSSLNKGNGFRQHQTQFVEGSNVNVKCKVSLGYPEANVQIKTHGRSVPSNSDYKHLNKQKYNETVKGSQVSLSHAEDGKVFQCTARNKHGKDVKDIKISVLYKVRDLFFPYNKNMKFTVGSQIECSAKGNPAPTINITAQPVNISMGLASKTVRWGKSVTPLPTNHATKDIPEDAAIGIYRIRCRARNIIGFDSHVGEITVLVQIVAPATLAGTLLPAVIILAVLLVLALLACLITFCKIRKKDDTLRRTRSRLSELEYAHSLRRMNTHSSLNDKTALSSIDPHDEMQQSTTLPVRSPSIHETQEDTPALGVRDKDGNVYV